MFNCSCPPFIHTGAAIPLIRKACVRSKLFRSFLFKISEENMSKVSDKCSLFLTRGIAYCHARKNKRIHRWYTKKDITI